jgi:hypothetical protein
MPPALTDQLNEAEIIVPRVRLGLPAWISSSRAMPAIFAMRRCPWSHPRQSLAIGCRSRVALRELPRLHGANGS